MVRSAVLDQRRRNRFEATGEDPIDVLSGWSIRHRIVQGTPDVGALAQRNEDRIGSDGIQIPHQHARGLKAQEEIDDGLQLVFAIGFRVDVNRHNADVFSVQVNGG